MSTMSLGYGKSHGILNLNKNFNALMDGINTRV